MSDYQKKITFVFIIIVAVFLRFYQLGNNPPSLTWDEAAWGYNAYSLGIDGKDEFGRFLPYDYLESFGDFKPPLYAYLTILPVKLWGLTEFATRFPSALVGVLTVIQTYFLVKSMFWKSRYRDYYAILSSFILGISPWHIMLSRAAFEANVATYLLVCAVWFFIFSTQKGKWFLVASVFFFVLSMYTFNTARIVAPLLGIVLTIGFYKYLLNNKKVFLISCIVGLVLLIPSLNFLLSPQASLRFREVNIFSNLDVIKESNQEIQNDGNAWWSKILHNRRLLYAGEFTKHYFDNLTSSFLFIKGDGNPKFSTQDVGQLYLWDLPFFVIGVLMLIRRKEGIWWLIPCWLLIGIIPAATARETPHALRIETTLPTFQIIIGYGVLNLWIFLQRRISSKEVFSIVVSSITVVLLMNITYFQFGYYSHYPREFSSEWQFGYKEAISYVTKEENKYDKIYFTTQLGRPYIYFLFYQKIYPEWFRSNATVQRDTFGFVTVGDMGKYIFADDTGSKRLSGKVLYITVPERVPPKSKIIKKFDLLNGHQSLVAYEI